MTFFDTSFGIDFRKNHLVLTHLKRSFGKIKLSGFEIHPLPPEEQAAEDRSAQLLGLINQFISKHAVNKEKVFISIPREKVFARFIQLPLATKENLRKVLEYEINKYSPFEKGDTYFDYTLLREEKDQLHLFAVFAKKTDVDPYLSLLKKIGIQPLSIQIPSIASLNLFFYHQNPKENENALLLDIAEPFFEMNLIEGGNWKESFHLPLPVEEREATILNTFRRSGLEEASFPRTQFFIYGLDAAEKMFPSLREAQQIKGVSPPPMNRIEVGAGMSRPDRIFSSIGVPLNGLVKTRLGLNLLPQEMRRKVREIGKPVFMILLSLVILLCLTLGMGFLVRYRSELETVNAEIKKRKPEVEAVEKLQKQSQTLSREMMELEKVRSGEVSKIDLLRELTQLLPETVWIWSLKYNGKELEISGFAESASDLIPLLDKSPLFEKVEFLSPVTKERSMRGAEVGKEKERFKIKARIEGRRVGS